MYCPKPPGWELWDVYAKLEKDIGGTKWYEFLKRKRLKEELFQLRMRGFAIGFESGIEDLVKAGILTRSKE